MIFLALDPALSTGYCVGKIDGDSVDLLEYGFIDVDNSSLYEGDWLIDLLNKVGALCKKWNVEELSVEDYFFGSRFCSGANVNVYFRGAIYLWARLNQKPYTILNISNWKVFVAGRSTPTKSQKLKWGKEGAKKNMIAQALYERFNIKLPNHSLSKSTGKPIIFRYDISDAIGQALYFANSKYNIKNYYCSVSIPTDVPMKKSKKSFSYDDLPK